MALVNANKFPKISDTVLFELGTPDEDGAFLANPYKVDDVKIFYVERSFASGNLQQFDKNILDAEAEEAAIEAEVLAAEVPTVENINAAVRLRGEANSTGVTSPFYFNEAKPIGIFGNPKFPAWLSTDLDNVIIENVPLDADLATQYGRFKLEWEPKGQREGDYFVCWTWTMLPAGDPLSAHFHFNLGGDTQLTTSIPTHFTVPEKYDTILERYTPEIYKVPMCDGDRTPDTIDNLNKSIGDGFIFVEDFVNQLVDLQDANSTHESLLPLLSNLFNLKLKTTDPTLWRRQIKQAIKLFKKKGTFDGLKEALDQTGIKLTKLTKLWQVTSPYTYQESFVVDGPPLTENFELAKVALPIDTDNFSLQIKYVCTDVWVDLTSDYIEFNTTGGVTTMTWVGDTLSTGAISLDYNDILVVRYQYAEVPNPTQQTIEDYIQALPLMDQRDETLQKYPPKNWNVHVIEEDDPLFDVLIPVRHPYHDLLVWGQIRTEFPYSENVYNMEEYNGSIRDSLNPCDIDREFVDPCTACQSSMYNIVLEIENLSNDKLIEAQDVLREFSPFHALLHSLTFVGGVNEFVQPPVETIEMLVLYKGTESVVAGEAQMYFNRAIKRGKTTAAILRDELATSEVAVATTTGIAWNKFLTVFAPDLRFDEIGLDGDGTTILENLTDTVETTLSSPDGHTAIVADTLEPLDEAAFTFRVSNPVLDGTLCDIFQDDIKKLSDTAQNYGLLGVKTDFDVEHGDAAAPWKAYIPAYDATPYTIQNLLPDGSLILNDPSGTLPTINTTGITYTIRTNLDVDVVTTSTGALGVTRRGRVQALSATVLDIDAVIDIEDHYFIDSTTQYKIIGFVKSTNDEFYISSYALGDKAGENLKVYKRLADNQIGYYSYRGLRLTKSGEDYETDLLISNGGNPPTEDNVLENNRFKENFLVKIGDDYFSIAEIDGNDPNGSTTIVLNGPENYWRTWTKGGTSVSFTIYRYVKEATTIAGQQFDFPEQDFDFIDRRGKELVTNTVETAITMMATSLPNGNEVNEYVYQEEAVSYSIEWADGTEEQGEI